MMEWHKDLHKLQEILTEYRKQYSLGDELSKSNHTCCSDASEYECADRMKEAMKLIVEISKKEYVKDWT